jgi:hypothetical protein
MIDKILWSPVNNDIIPIDKRQMGNPKLILTITWIMTISIAIYSISYYRNNTSENFIVSKQEDSANNNSIGCVESNIGVKKSENLFKEAVPDNFYKNVNISVNLQVFDYNVCCGMSLKISSISSIQIGENELISYFPTTSFREIPDSVFLGTKSIACQLSVQNLSSSNCNVSEFNCSYNIVSHLSYDGFIFFSQVNNNSNGVCYPTYAAFFDHKCDVNLSADPQTVFIYDRLEINSRIAMLNKNQTQLCFYLNNRSLSSRLSLSLSVFLTGLAVITILTRICVRKINKRSEEILST